jgi:hypothetical protein
MAGPSGFVTRVKGKATYAALWLGASAQYGNGAYVAYSTAGTQTLGREKVSSINASSGASVFTMSELPVPGLEREINMITVSSAAFLKAAAGASFDASTNTVIKSTYTQRISLLGLTTAKWQITGVYPDNTAGGAPVGGITLSTTT